MFLVKEENGGTQFAPVELHLPDDFSRDLLVDAIDEGKDNSLWLGTNHGLLRRNPDGRIEHFTIQESARSDLVNRLLVDRQGRIWIGHTSALYVLNPEPLNSTATPAKFISRPLRARRAVAGALPFLPDGAGEAIDYSKINGLKVGCRVLR